MKAELATLAKGLETKGQAFWQEAQLQLNQVETKLEAAQSALKQGSEEALLQGHLAAMEASERWNFMKESVEKAAQEGSRKAKTGLDYAVLKAHLAKMESIQFMQEDGKDWINHIKSSRVKATEKVAAGIITMSKHLDMIASNLRRDV